MCCITCRHKADEAKKHKSNLFALLDVSEVSTVSSPVLPQYSLPTAKLIRLIIKVFMDNARGNYPVLKEEDLRLNSI